MRSILSTLTNMFKRLPDPIPFLLFIPAFIIFGAVLNPREWIGASVGGLVGLVFSLVASDMVPAKVVKAVFPGEPVKEENDDSV